MAIKSSTFGRAELSGKDAARFVQHMNEDQLDVFGFSGLGVALLLLSHGTLAGHLVIKNGIKWQHMTNSETG